MLYFLGLSSKKEKIDNEWNFQSDVIKTPPQNAFIKTEVHFFFHLVLFIFNKNYYNKMGK